jgi:hypothetical protein
MGPIGSKRYVTAVCYDMMMDGGGEKTPHVILSLRVVEGEETGRNLIARCYLSACKPGKKMGAIDITRKQLRALGWTGTQLSKAMAEGLGTRKADVCLTVEEYNGKLSEKVTDIREPRVFAPKNPVETSDIAAFDALFADAFSDGADLPPLTEANRAPAVLPPAIDYRPPTPVAEPDPF